MAEIKLILALIVIVFSVLSEIAKIKNDSTKSGDSVSENELFSLMQLDQKEQQKKQEKIQENGCEMTDEKSIMEMRQMVACSPPVLSLPVLPDLKRQKKVKISGQERGLSAGRRQSEIGYSSSECPCINETPVFTGVVDGTKVPQGGWHPRQNPVRNVSRDKHKMSRRDILNAFIFSELMQRYDLNRIFSRIPERHRDS
ncbi:MAG: hypothetical protein HQM09_15880 [Candidatus Riflebacteria bacterium]|nr:hypothetical protein [Candidatus Riflebacteria bacterium]